MRIEHGDLIFATANEFKYDEAVGIASQFNVRLVRHPFSSTDIQSADMVAVAEAKARAAYEQLLRPLFVDQTSLHIDAYRGFPGGSTEYFLSCLSAEQVCLAFGGGAVESGAEGRTTLSYCDGRQVRSFVGTIRGRIVPSPRGDSTGWASFGWNRIFAPDGSEQTFAEMGLDAKNTTSMRRHALEALFDWVA